MSLSKSKAKELLQKSIDAIVDLQQSSYGSDQFTKWKRDTEVAIEHIFTADSRHLNDFKSIKYIFSSGYAVGRIGDKPKPPRDTRPDYMYGLKQAKAILESMVGEIETYGDDGISDTDEAKINALEIIQLICSQFHKVVRQLRQRHNERPTLDINDEYDVQDLLHALLRIYFQDIREEEGTPSYAGGASRIDFLLKEEQILIEVKKTRATLKAKELGEQLIVDIERYKTHPNCKLLYCFVYDPDGYIKNPKGIENDLRRSGEPFPVEIFIAPK